MPKTTPVSVRTAAVPHKNALSELSLPPLLAGPASSGRAGPVGVAAQAKKRGQPYIVAQEPIRFWMEIVAAHGLIVLLGVVVIVKHLLTLKPAPSAA